MGFCAIAMGKQQQKTLVKGKDAFAKVKSRHTRFSGIPGSMHKVMTSTQNQQD